VYYGNIISFAHCTCFITHILKLQQISVTGELLKLIVKLQAKIALVKIWQKLF